MTRGRRCPQLLRQVYRLAIAPAQRLLGGGAFALPACRRRPRSDCRLHTAYHDEAFMTLRREDECAPACPLVFLFRTCWRVETRSATLSRSSWHSKMQSTRLRPSAREVVAECLPRNFSLVDTRLMRLTPSRSRCESNGSASILPPEEARREGRDQKMCPPRDRRQDLSIGLSARRCSRRRCARTMTGSPNKGGAAANALPAAKDILGVRRFHLRREASAEQINDRIVRTVACAA